MKLTIRLSSVSIVSFVGLLLALLVLADLRAHRSSLAVSYAPASTSERVVTKEFVLVDDEGRTRARIGMSDSNTPSLQLFDRTGGQRAMLRLNKDDVPSLRLFDEAGKLRSVTGFSLNDQTPQFIQFDEYGQGHALQNSTYQTSNTFAMFRDEDARGWNQYFFNTPEPRAEAPHYDSSQNPGITTMGWQR